MVEVKNIETHFPKNLKEDDFENREDFLQNISVTFDMKITKSAEEIDG